MAVPISKKLHDWMLAQRDLASNGPATAKALDYSLKCSAWELARQRRLEALATLLAELDIAQAKLERQCETLAAERSLAERERKSVPSERPLHDAIAAALQVARDVDRTR